MPCGASAKTQNRPCVNSPRCMSLAHCAGSRISPFHGGSPRSMLPGLLFRKPRVCLGSMLPPPPPHLMAEQEISGDERADRDELPDMRAHEPPRFHQAPHHALKVPIGSPRSAAARANSPPITSM